MISAALAVITFYIFTFCAIFAALLWQSNEQNNEEPRMSKKVTKKTKRRTVMVSLEVESSVPIKDLKKPVNWICCDDETTIVQIQANVIKKSKSH